MPSLVSPPDSRRIDVDCIIPCYNDAGTINQAIRSVLGQDIEGLGVIVVNDGSTDDSLLEIGTINDSRIRVISQANSGPAAARNVGIRASSALFCAFLDADDRWYPGKLRFQLEALQDASPKIIGHCVSFRQLRENGKAAIRVMPSPDRFRDTLLDVCMTTIGSTLLVRRAAFDSVGLFDETLRCFEDWDWQLRCLLHGFCFETSPQVFVDKQEHGRRSGTIVENGCSRLRQRLTEISTVFGRRSARKLASALYFEEALSNLFQRKWLACGGKLAVSLCANPWRLMILFRQAVQRLGRSATGTRDPGPHASTRRNQSA